MPNSLGPVMNGPIDDLQTIMIFEYNFNGEVEDRSQYDDQIKKLQEQIRVMSTK